MPAQKHYRLNRRIIVALVTMMVVSFVIIAYTFFLNTDGLRRAVAFFEARILTYDYTASSDLDQLPLSLGDAKIAYTLYDKNNNVLWQSANLQRPLPLRSFIMNRDWLQWPGTYFSGNVLMVPAYLKDGTTMMIAKEDLQQRQILHDIMQERLFNTLLLLIPVIVLATLILMPLLLLWILRPVRSAANVATEINPHDWDRRIPLEGLPYEVIPLADAANQALNRLARAYQSEKSFVADAAHELRTPLTILDLHIQEIQQQGKTDIDAMLRQRDQMRLLVEQLLSLARHEHQQLATTAPQLIDLTDLLQSAVDSQTPLFAKQQRSLIFESEETDLFCLGNEYQLLEVINNVLNNALIHGKGTTTLHGYRTADHMIIDIADEGTDLPYEQAELMFTRFKKRVANTPGSGLGLAIVRQILHNNGGDIAFVNATSTLIRITLAAAGLDNSQHDA